VSFAASVVLRDAAELVTHGTARGFLEGCRSRGACPNHGSPDYLTCVEADSARRSDFRLARMPRDQPLPRDRQDPRPIGLGGAIRRRTAPRQRDVPRRLEREGRTPTPVHGTTTGYLKGCRGDACPRGVNGLTCREVRNAARRDRARRLGIRPRPRSVSAEPAAQRIEELKAAGLSLRGIARLTGIGHTTITNIACGQIAEIWPTTCARILLAPATPPARE